MKNKVLVVLLFLAICSFSQEKETFYVVIDNVKANKKEERVKFLDLIYTQFDVSLPLVLNTNLGNYYPDGDKDKNWFLPNGLGAKFGVGIQTEGEWIGLSINTGIDWKINPKMVVSPIYTNLRLGFYISENSKINLQTGFGKGIALGRGQLYGNFQKYSIGIENDDNLSIFAEVSGYDFKSNPIYNFGSLSLGIGFRN